MPRLDDIHSVMVIGSGPIVIGQGCEFDYSGTQAIRALREEGMRIILINSNPATIMTDPEMADATYIEPLTFDACRSIIEKERPDALLPTLGGQTALNLAMELSDSGVLEEFGVRLIGVDLNAIRRAEDRSGFKALCEEAGFDTPRSAVVRSMEEAMRAVELLGLPAIIRPSFTLGGSGSGMARTREEFLRIVKTGLTKSPVHEVLIEESIEGWKEYELELMRDRDGNNVVVCSIENLDPMGVHTGDSITVAPVQTLRDREYQAMRDAAFTIMDAVGIWGGANVQFAIQPETGRMTVIEMNPRVSRSSALASKATGYPIAKVAARLALGYTLAELPNDVVGTIPAAFEPSLDYVVVKIPRWNFEKFHGVADVLGSQMQSIGEVMALGRTFNEALQKALRSLESDWGGFETLEFERADIEKLLSTPNSLRLFAVKAAYQTGMTTQRIYELSRIDPWFLENLQLLVRFEERVRAQPFPPAREFMREAKRFGFSDRQLAGLWTVDEAAVTAAREAMDIHPVVKMVDTCAGEFEARTPYYYIVYDDECDVASDTRRAQSGKDKVVILGSGPNRIGQGIEFDYCCVHAAMALRDMGYESIMVNCNPETVSTDFDISDRLYFEPVAYEHVMAIVRKERPVGVIFQFGGQTPLKLLHRLAAAGVPVLGTGVEAVDQAEDRERCHTLMNDLGILHPPCAFASTRDAAVREANRIGYPVLLRPPYVLGGRAMELARSEDEVLGAIDSALRSSESRALMIDKFIEGAVEVDVDCVSDGENVAIAGIMEHMEEAGIHSGDSSCVIPPLAIEEEIIDEIKLQTIRIARALGLVGMMNAQYAIKDNRIYCFEINPRASRTVPYVSKATGVQWIKVATRAIMGEKLDMQRYGETIMPEYMSVKAPVFPFEKFPGVDSILGPEMRSTGEVMGIGETFDEAFIKAQLAAGYRLPKGSHVFISVANRYKRKVIFPVKALREMGFQIVATPGMAGVLRSHGVPVRVVRKINEGDSDILEMIEDGSIQLVVNMAWSRKSILDDKFIRLAANKMKVPCITTMAGFHALVLGLQTISGGPVHVETIQNYNARLPLLKPAAMVEAGALRAGEAV
ncbi:MAG TPA: carbamoyl-phosphate synthase large subunit [Candidatus Krumholzibacteria bacterium]|nr:carbamoyl-phosphate synthase large subunit [Candidatus Krumholzibacteria bacterium]